MTVIRSPLPSPGLAPAAPTTTITLSDVAPSLQRLAPGTVLRGTVAGRSGGDATLITTAAGPVRLPVSAALTPGSTVTIQVVANGPQTQITILAIRSPELTRADASVLPRELATGSLDEASLIHRWPTAEAANATSPDRLAIPRTGPQLAAAVAQFVVALRNGDFDRWLDLGVVRALESGAGPQTAARLREDFTTLAALASRSEGEEWQLLVFPFLSGTALQQARLYLGRQGSDSDEPGSARRFLLQLATSPFGWMQLDGLVGGKRFDLIVRTETSMPDPLRGDLASIFTAATRQAGYSGLLDFASGTAVTRLAVANPAPQPRGLLI
jgi:hypothetical protein